MLDALVRYSLENRLSAFLLAITLAIAGWFSYKSLTIEAFPDPTDTQVQIITLFPGQPTEEVERRLSIPIERALNGTPGLLRLRSISLFGLSFVTLTFDDDVTLVSARQRVLEKIRSVDLPEGVDPDLGPMATPIGEVFRYTLQGAASDPMKLRTLQDWTVRPELLRVQGVADVVSYGGLVKEVHVQPDPVKMSALGVGLNDVFTAIKTASSNATGGYVERGAEVFVIRSVGIFSSMDDIARTRIKSNKGVPILIRDVATVTEGYLPRQGVVVRDADDDAVQGIVLMRRGENPSTVLPLLAERVKELNERILPPGVKISPFYDRTTLVDSTLHTVFHNLLEGATLVTLVLFAFTLSIQASLIVATVIPLSLAASFAYLRARGMSANLLSMGAIDFGIIVDGAVILVEHLFHKVPLMDDRDTPIEKRIFRAAQEVSRPTLFSLLIIIAAYIPIFALERVEGRMFAPMANTVVSALVGALVVSFTLVPVLALYSLRKHHEERESPLLRWAARAYEPALQAAMARPVIVAVLGIGALVASFVLLPRLGSEFLPELNEGALYVTFTLPRNISQTDGRRLIPRLEGLLRRTPEVDSVLAQLGRPEDGTDPKLPNNLEVFLRLKPLDTWRKEKPLLNDLVQEMTKNLEEVPGIEYNFSQPIRDNVLENISGQQGQIALKLYGEDLDTLQKSAEHAKDIIAGVAGVADLALVKSGESPEVTITIDRDGLARYDLDLEEVQNYIETAMAGHVASELWEGEKRFDVTVRLPRSTREDITAIRELMLPTQNGVIPLDAVADVTLAKGRAAITRENGKRYIGVRMNVRNRDMGSFVEEARTKVDAGLKMPPGYLATWGGEFENQQRAMKRLGLVIPVALIITFFLLFSAFGSIGDAAIILLHVPLALVGGVLGLAVAGMTLSVSAAVGFIALLGQAVLNGVLVVAAIRQRLRDGEDRFEAVTGGVRDRLRAVLMTALLAALGLLPAAVSHAIGSETQRPIAVVVVGGTLSAALLTLIVLPVSYFCALEAGAWLERRRARRSPALA
jgi:cobalt-zinc-cadmium resistance protein CzcA